MTPGIRAGFVFAGFVVAALAGFFARDLIDILTLDVTVSRARMHELTQKCRLPLQENPELQSDLVAALDSPDTKFSDLEFGFEDSCAFKFGIGDNSTMAGWGFVASTSHGITRVHFFNWTDTSLLNAAKPSFHVLLFEVDGAQVAVDTRVPARARKIGATHRR